jgi:Skp family chaperone for outer membrane proteins
MSFRRYLAATALIAPALMFGSASVAQAQQLDGPPVPGVCMLSQEAIFANAKAGVAASAHLRDLAKAVLDPLIAERQSIVNEDKALRAAKPADFQAKEQALAQRDRAAQISMQKAERQVELTKAKVRTQIGQAAQPVVADVFHAHSCGLLINRDVVMGGNTSNDLTAGVIQGLDARMTTLSFDLEPLPAPKQ